MEAVPDERDPILDALCHIERGRGVDHAEVAQRTALAAEDRT